MLCSDRQLWQQLSITTLRGAIKLKDDFQLKVKLLKQLNSNLNFLLEDPEGKPIEQLIMRLALIDQCIEQTLLLILFEELDGNLPQKVNQLSH